MNARHVTHNKDDLAVRLGTFFEVAQRRFRDPLQCDHMAGRLTYFFSAAAGRLHRLVRHQSAQSIVNRARLSRALDELSPALAKARSTGIGINPWSVAGLWRYEVRTVAVLAALWQPRLGGEAATEFLDAFLEQLRPAAAGLPSRAQLERGYSVRTEHCVAGAASERVDLTIEGADFLVAIEVKVDAPEGLDQLARYSEATVKGARNKSACLIFLAPYAPPLGFTGIAGRWTDVAAGARTCLPAKVADYSFNQHLMASFARHIAGF